MTAKTTWPMEEISWPQSCSRKTRQLDPRRVWPRVKALLAYVKVEVEGGGSIKEKR